MNRPCNFHLHVRAPWYSRFYHWVTDITWRDVGVFTALMSAAEFWTRQGKPFHALFCFVLGAVVYFTGERVPS